ncbi:MAG: hypothetical protein WED10_12675 [Brumimicrobium sp.]
MLKQIFIFIFTVVLSLSSHSQNCPDDINNSPGNSGNTVIATVYDASGNVIQSITCDATGNSGQIDCDLDSYNFPGGSFVAIDFSNGPNTTTCIYDTDGELIEDPIGLPVDFGGLSVENVDEKNVLNWVTYSEQNNNHFILAYSKNGIDWTEFDKIDGAGNSNTTLEYSSIHRDYKSGINYYRLLQEDIDGKKTVLATESIENKTNLEIKSINNEIHINSNKEIEEIKCISLTGKIIDYEFLTSKSNFIKIDLINVSTGIVVVQVRGVNGEVEYKKLFLGH